MEFPPTFTMDTLLLPCSGGQRLRVARRRHGHLQDRDRWQFLTTLLSLADSCTFLSKSWREPAQQLGQELPNRPISRRLSGPASVGDYGRRQGARS